VSDGWEDVNTVRKGMKFGREDVSEGEEEDNFRQDGENKGWEEVNVGRKGMIFSTTD